MATVIWLDLVFSVCGSTFVPPNRGVEQLVARWAHNPKVTSSSLVPATNESNPSGCFFYVHGLRPLFFNF